MREGGAGNVVAGVFTAAMGGGAGGVGLVLPSSRFRSFAIPSRCSFSAAAAASPSHPPLLSSFFSFAAAAWVTWPSCVCTLFVWVAGSTGSRLLLLLLLFSVLEVMRPAR